MEMEINVGFDSLQSSLSWYKDLINFINDYSGADEVKIIIHLTKEK